MVELTRRMGCIWNDCLIILQIKLNAVSVSDQRNPLGVKQGRNVSNTSCFPSLPSVLWWKACCAGTHHSPHSLGGNLEVSHKLCSTCHKQMPLIV